MDLADKYRPKLLKEVIGQPDAVKALSGMLKNGGVPAALLFQGHSGAGKTTTARILKTKLNCADFDFIDINAAEERGIDVVRDRIKNRLSAGLSRNSECRIWLIDECHRLTHDSQSALLTIVEKPPRHVKFFFCTTDPPKLLRTLRDRCTPITFAPVGEKLLCEHVAKIAALEKIEVSRDVCRLVAQHAEGSVRRALKTLDLIRHAEDDNERARIILNSDPRKLANDLVRILVWQPNTPWKDVADILLSVDEDVESLRRMILAVATTELLKAGKNAGRAACLISVFRDHWFDCGKAGLVSACYEILNRK